MRQAIIITGLLVLLPLAAQADGLNAPASLLPPGYRVPAPASPAPQPMAVDDQSRSGMGEADLAPATGEGEASAMPMLSQEPMGQATSQADYVDVPPLAAMPQPQVQTGYTQGITTGPKAYSEGNFTFKAQ